MRRLILQMQTSIDMFVADKAGGMGWTLWDYGRDWPWDDQLRQYHIDTIASADIVLLSSKMARQGFIQHWTSIGEDTQNPEAAFAKHVTDIRKIVFSHRPMQSEWERTDISNDLRGEVAKLKSVEGKNLIAFGGAGFATSLLAEDLVDELHLIVNPVIIGEGLSIFENVRPARSMSLLGAQSYSQGMVVARYGRAQ